MKPLLLLLLLAASGTASCLVQQPKGGDSAPAERGAGGSQQQRRRRLAAAAAAAAATTTPGAEFHAWRMRLLSRFPEHAGYVNIVGRRETLGKLPGPPPAHGNATHPAALARLADARAVLSAVAAARAPSMARAAAAFMAGKAAAVVAAADDDAVLRLTAAADDAAADDEESGGETGSAAAGGGGGDDNNAAGDGSGKPQRLLQGLGGRLPWPAGNNNNADDAVAAAAAATPPPPSPPDARRRAALVRGALRDPFPPVAAPQAAAELALMSFVRRGGEHSGARLTLGGRPWLMAAFDVLDALQLAVGGNGGDDNNAGRRQLLFLMDRAARLGFNTLRFRAYADGGASVGSASDELPPEPGSSKGRSGRRRRGDDPLALRPPLAAALQPAPGVLNVTVLREGLDWLVWQAGLRGLKLLPILTGVGGADGFPGFVTTTTTATATAADPAPPAAVGGPGPVAAAGGAVQYTQWVDRALPLGAFYGNDTVKSVFLDYVAGLLGHAATTTSSSSSSSSSAAGSSSDPRRSSDDGSSSSTSGGGGGLPLREDPMIVGWQLGEALAHPGVPASDALLAWIRQVGRFLRERAPQQLVFAGVDGAFGPASPHHLRLNPPATAATLFAPASGAPHAPAAHCAGGDFWVHHSPPEVDVAAAALLPDQWLGCDRACKLAWARDWARAHLRDALRLQKPLLLGPVAALRPHAWRRDVLELARGEVAGALARGPHVPVAGLLLAGLAHADAPDGDGWAIYLSRAAVARPPPPLPPPASAASAAAATNDDDSNNDDAAFDAAAAANAASLLAWHRWAGHDAMLRCVAAAARGAEGGGGEGGGGGGGGSVDAASLARRAEWVSGWDEAVGAVAAWGRLAAQHRRSEE